MEYPTKNKTMYELLVKQKNIFTDITLMLFSIILLAVMANIRIPLWPVPITMQTFGVFLIAFFFGSRKGALTIALYLLAGLAGFGVFSYYKSGLSVIAGPTGGYLFGFIIAVFSVGLLIEKGMGRTKSSIIFCMAFGSIIIYTAGIIGLFNYFGNISMLKALEMGVFPFLVGDMVKIFAATLLFPVLWKK